MVDDAENKEQPENPEDEPQAQDQTPDDQGAQDAAAESGATDGAASAATDPPAEAGADVDGETKAAWAKALEETSDAEEPAHALADASQAHPVDFPDLGPGKAPGGAGNIGLLMEVHLPVSIELGRTTQPISEILQWGQGSIVELDKLAGEPVNLLVNNKLVAKGEVVVVDENFGLRITSLIAGRERDALR